MGYLSRLKEYEDKAKKYNEFMLGATVQRVEAPTQPKGDITTIRPQQPTGIDTIRPTPKPQPTITPTQPTPTMGDFKQVEKQQQPQPKIPTQAESLRRGVEDYKQLTQKEDRATLGQDIANVGEWAKANAIKGIAEFDRGMFNAISAIGGSKVPVLKDIIKYYNKQGDIATEKAEQFNTTTAKKVFGDAITSTLQMLPSLVLTALSGGAAAPALTAGTTAAKGTIARLGQTIANNAKIRPDMIPLFISSFGNAYDEATKEGASYPQAVTRAFLMSYPETLIEQSGGLQTLIPDLKRAGKQTSQTLTKQILNSMIEEMGEEVTQYPLGALSKQLTYDKSVPYYSTEGEAVINPKEMAYSAGVAGIVSGALGGGGAAINRIANARVQQPTVQPQAEQQTQQAPITPIAPTTQQATSTPAIVPTQPTAQPTTGDITAIRPRTEQAQQPVQQPVGTIAQPAQEVQQPSGILATQQPQSTPQQTSAFRGLSQWRQARQKGNITKIEKPSDIVKAIEKDLGVPITKGKVTARKAKGMFKVSPETIRIKVANDLPVVAHEVGHYLDKKYNLQNSESINEIIGLLPDEFMNLYKEKEIPGEAVAEFMRLYMTDKVEAERQAPTFYNEFINTVDNQTLDLIDTSANRIQSYLSLPSIERSKAFIQSRTDIKSDSTINETLDKIYTRVFDDLNPIQLFTKYTEQKKGTKLKGAENPYIMALNSRGADIIAKTITTERFVDNQGNTIGKSLRNILERIDNKKYKDFSNYLVNKHAIEWLTPDKEGNTKRVFADEALNNLQTVQENVRYYEQIYPEFIEVANEIYEYQNNLIDKWLVETGLLSQEVANELKQKYKNYVPFYRDVGKGDARARRGFADQTTPIKRAKGSGADILDPIESIIVNTERFVKAAKRNEVMQIIDRLYNTTEGLGIFLERVPPDMLPQRTDLTQLKEQLSKAGEEAGIEEIDALIDNIIEDTMLTFRPKRVNTKQDLITVMVDGEQKTYQVHDREFLNAISSLSPQTTNWVVSTIGQLTRVMKNLTTGINPIFGIGRNAWRDIPTSFILKRSKGFNYLGHIGDIMKAFVDVIRNTEQYQEYHSMGGGHSSSISANRNLLNETLNELIPGRKFSNALNLGEYLVSLVERFNNAIESAPRFAEYKKTVGTGTYSEKMQAIFESQDVSVNFKRHGKWTKDLDAFIPYLNAAMQGIDKMARASKESPGSFYLKMFISTVIPTLVLYAVNHDDEDYQKLSSYMKDNHFNIKLNNGKFWRIPKPRELGVFASGIERVLDYWKTDDPDAFYMFMDYVITNFAPPINRTILAPFNDVRANKNFANIPIVSQELLNLPNQYQYDERTSAIAKGIGSTFDLSPKQIDYIINSYTGILGKINSAFTAQEKDFSAGLVRSITADPLYSTDILNKFYDELNRQDKLKKESEIKGEAVAEFDAEKLKALNQTSRKISELRRYAKDVEKSDLDKKEKEELLKQLRREMLDVAQKVMESMKPKINTSTGDINILKRKSEK